MTPHSWWRFSGWRTRLLSACAILVVLSIAFPAATQASHSVRNIVRAWDIEDNGYLEIVSDSRIDWDPEAGDWNATRENSLQVALDTWRTNTDWNPGLDSGSPWDVFIDGRNAPCTAPWSQLDDTVAYNCDSTIRRLDFRGETYDDIESSNIYFDTNGYDWEYGGGGYDPSDPRFSFRGVLVHELGHGAGLGHYNPGPCSSGSQIESMCKRFSAAESFYLATLRSDDEQSANCYTTRRSGGHVMRQLMLLAGGLLLVSSMAVGCARGSIGAGQALDSPSVPPSASVEITDPTASPVGPTPGPTVARTTTPTPVDLHEAAKEALLGGPVLVGTCFTEGSGGMVRRTPEEFQQMIEAAGGIDRFIGASTFAGSPPALAAAKDAELIGYDEAELWILEADHDPPWAIGWTRDESTDGTDIWRAETFITLGCGEED